MHYIVFLWGVHMHMCTYVCMCVQEHTHDRERMWRVEDNFQELVLSFHSVGFRNGTHSYPRRHHKSLKIHSLIIDRNIKVETRKVRCISVERHTFITWAEVSPPAHVCIIPPHSWGTSKNTIRISCTSERNAESVQMRRWVNMPCCSLLLWSFNITFADVLRSITAKSTLALSMHRLYILVIDSQVT